MDFNCGEFAINVNIFLNVMRIEKSAIRRGKKQEQEFGV